MTKMNMWQNHSDDCIIRFCKVKIFELRLAF